MSCMCITVVLVKLHECTRYYTYMHDMQVTTQLMQVPCTHAERVFILIHYFSATACMSAKIKFICSYTTTHISHNESC